MDCRQIEKKIKENQLLSVDNKNVRKLSLATLRDIRANKIENKQAPRRLPNFLNNAKHEYALR